MNPRPKGTSPRKRPEGTCSQRTRPRNNPRKHPSREIPGKPPRLAPAAPHGQKPSIMKRLSYVLALLGLLIALLLVSYYGFGNVVAAVSRVGWPQFALILGWELVLFVTMGVVW